MEDFTPTGNMPEEEYRPEDEYASIDDATAPVDAPAAESVSKPTVESAPEPVQKSESAPAAETPRAPEPQAAVPVYPVYPQAVYPCCGQMPYRMPVQPPYPMPQAYVPPTQAYMPPVQPYMPPVQPYYPAAQPEYPQVQPTPAVQTPQPQTANSENPFTATAVAPQPDPHPTVNPVDNRPAQKPPTSTGTKVFIIILIALLVALITGFAVYIAHIADKEKSADNSGSGITLPDDYSDPFRYNDNNGSEEQGFDSYEEITREITLVEDKGETQKRSDDNPETVGQPDENAKELTLQPLPKDKDNEKYTTQSAYDAVSESVVTVDLYEEKISDNTSDLKGSGTGTIISADGYIITNAHVVGNSRRYAVKITMNSGETYQAKVIGYDSWTDLAVLKIDAKGLTPVVFGDSELIEIGQDVIAVGSPGGEKFKNSLTKGIVSAVDRELSINKYVKYIQSDAAISPGNSGGPLCNIYGQVIGINTAKSTATNYEAMTFSIPSETVKQIVSELMRYGYVRGRSRIGFSGTEISAEEHYYYGYPAGIYINEIDSEGAFAGVDIKEGDIVTAIDGEEVTSFQDIYAVLNQHKAGDKVEIKLSRPKKEKQE